MLDAVRRKLEPAIRRVLHVWWWLSRGMTLGVRAVVLDGEGRVFLVRHTYVSGWHLPGGGVENAETFLDALRRELQEEGAIELIGEPVLHGIFFNRRVSRRDHVAVYVIRSFRQEGLPAPGWEIAECGFFDPNALPEGTTRGTRQRISEVLAETPIMANWS